MVFIIAVKKKLYQIKYGGEGGLVSKRNGIVQKGRNIALVEILLTKTGKDYLIKDRIVDKVAVIKIGIFATTNLNFLAEHISF